MPTVNTRFTKPAIPHMTCPAGAQEAFFWDAVLPGFGLRAYASGRRIWIAQYRDPNGRTRRAAFGEVGTVELDEARGAARRLLSQAQLGADPQAEKRAARRAVRVGALVDAYLADARGRLKPKSLEEVTRHLKMHAKPLHAETAAAVGRADVVKLLAALVKGGSPVTANRVRSSLSAMWVWGMRSGTIEGENPVAHVPKPTVEAPRERVLADAEIALIWHATGGEHDHDRIVRLLMLTGARREEVAGLHWSEIEGSVWTLPRVRSKNGIPHEVPLSPLAMQQLPSRRAVARTQGEPSAERPLAFGEGKAGFSGWSRCKDRLDSRIERARFAAFAERHGRAPSPDELPPMNWTLHDLRRTLSTWLNETGTDPHIVEAVLNHVSGAAKRGVAGVYNKAQYREPKRIALARWEAHVRQIAGLPSAEGGNVVALARTA